MGRDAPRGRVAALLDGLRQGRGGALVIAGEPGIGKTALLECAMAEARACTVLRAVGLESESELPFVALGDALRPLLPLIGKLPPPQATALRTALALEAAAQPAARYAVCMATLTLLTVAAENLPVLVVADDAHWLDPASAAVLSFTARRLANDPVGMLLTVRDGAAAELDIRGLERLALTGLDAADSGRLAEQFRGAPIAPQVAGRMWEATRGNPLALREVAAHLDEQQLAGVRPLPDALPLGADLTRAFTDQLGPLPEDTRTALLVLALAAAPEVPVLLAALETLGLPPGVLDPADAAGLIVTDGDRVRFCHPLVRSAVESAAGGWARRRAYQALIASSADDTRLRYRAIAATAPDDDLADELEQAARRMRDRSGLAAAARVTYRAAQLATDPERRARRLLQAGADALGGGRLDEATSWLDHARMLTADPRTAADVDLMRGRALITRGTPAIALQVLTTAADAAAATDPGRAARLLCEAALPIFTEGRVRAAEESCRRAVRLAEAAGDPEVLARSGAVLAQALVLGGQPAAARTALDAAASALDPVADALVLSLIGACYHWSEEQNQARRLLDRVIDAARRAGQLATLGHALNYRSEVDRRTGDWVQAYARAEEALRLAEETRLPLTIGFSLVLLARLDAVRGRAGLVAARLDRAARMSGPLGTGGLAMWEGGVRGLLHLTAGAPERAVPDLEEVRDFAGANGIGNPNAILWQPDLVEAYWRCGRVDEAERCLADLDRRAAATGLPTPRAVAERCHGMLSEDPEEADAHFAAADELHRLVGDPFERARSAQCHAEALRRHRRPAKARATLREALAVFRRLGADPYARRAAAELAAAGERPPGPARDPSPVGRLTPQELQVATAVARGLSNPEVAAAIFLSRKTVEAHLSSVYRKLGLSSRTQLVRYLTEAGVAPP
ncbi:helix-turn-helix transcriptional regulator [Actinoplanes sp. CA-142083]|uniref:helix-turn-helix transcriptional regulator n=1 Tax=Actinoplanes sp. CA-142083 TaxID=3239903 RepID=UPI003D8BE701